MAMLAAQDVVIRRASPGEAETVAAITRAAYARYVPLLGRQPQPMTADYRQILAEHSVWLLCLGDQPVGVLVLMKATDHLLVYNVAVSPAYQKRGLGRQLLAWAEQEGRQAGYTRLRLYTNALMVENIALYRRLGYVETAREPYLGSTLVHMEKHLDE
ncbi:MAG: GNAT family N-acetyltransferase [Anaerolineae bacterium]|jgi:ribosomal protein S18 acetylase RimI-like enzyme|nr:GNAT family N-acetyltransferase [Anaerolineae bacterium]